MAQAKSVVRCGGDTREKDLLHVGMWAWLLSSPGVAEDKMNPSSAKVTEGPGPGTWDNGPSLPSAAGTGDGKF